MRELVESSFVTSFYCFGCLVGLPTNAKFEVKLRETVVRFPGDIVPRKLWTYEYAERRLQFVWLNYLPQTGEFFCFSCLRTHEPPEVLKYDAVRLEAHVR